MRWLNRFMMAVFFVCLLLQFNEPDPVVWAAMYSVPIVGGYLWERTALGRLVPGIAAAVALIIAVGLIFSAPMAAPLENTFEQWQMMGEHSEVLREAGGLVLIAGWLAALAFVGSGAK